MGEIIYDFGMNEGSDTDYYLAKGFKVVAVEANSMLCSQAERRFAQQIADGRLVLLNVALARADVKEPVVFYLHGARWNLTGNLNRIGQLHQFGFSVFAIDYRGFGKSDGDLPSEATVYEDARAGWNWVIAHEPDPARRFIYGHSLGGAVAVDLAASLGGEGDGARGLIIESTFTNFADMTSEITRGLIPSIMLSQKFDSVGKIARVKMPVLVVHGEGDRFVPVRFSEALYKAAPTPKRLLLVPNGSHNNSLSIGGSDYHRALIDFFGLDRTRSFTGEG